MFLICGLGNPGKNYVDTRHNVGFSLIKKLSIFYNFTPLKKDNKKIVFKGLINNNKCLLMQPLTYMNLSGQPIQEIINFYKIEKNKLYVVHDDLDLELGKIKIKLGGGNGGQGHGAMRPLFPFQIRGRDSTRQRNWLTSSSALSPSAW